MPYEASNSAVTWTIPLGFLRSIDCRIRIHVSQSKTWFFFWLVEQLRSTSHETRFSHDMLHSEYGLSFSLNLIKMLSVYMLINIATWDFGLRYASDLVCNWHVNIACSGGRLPKRNRSNQSPNLPALGLYIFWGSGFDLSQRHSDQASQSFLSKKIISKKKAPEGIQSMYIVSIYSRC